MVRLQCPQRLFADGFLPSGIYFALPVPAPPQAEVRHWRRDLPLVSLSLCFLAAT